MEHLTVARANDIVDRIAEIAMGGGFNQPVALNRVGATSTAEALAALYVVTAELFQTWALNKKNSHNQKVLREFIKGVRGTGLWVAMNFNTEGKVTGNLAVDPSVKDSETIESFVKFLCSLDPVEDDYWDRVYSRLARGFWFPEKVPRVEYYDDGKKKLESHWKNGEKHGLWTEWNENGKKIKEAHYKNGKADGLVTVWNENGNKTREIEYKDGKRVNYKEF